MIIIVAMPINKNALLRYKTIDRCLRNKYRRWTLDDLVEACSDALYEMEGIVRGVSMRTIQGDIHIMRSDKLGYNAPIEVYDNKFYRYADPDYSINDSPMEDDTYDLVIEALRMIRRREASSLEDMEEILQKIGTHLNAILLHQ